LGLLAISVGFGIFGHSYEDGNKFVGFLPHGIDRLSSDTAVIAEEFQPELRFIGFLDACLDFGNKFFGTSGAGGLAILGSHRSCRTDQLFSDYVQLIPSAIELYKKANHGSRKLLRAIFSACFLSSSLIKN
jgi:hypothetical protein